MDVSMERPPLMAQALAPLPRWSVMTLVSALVLSGELAVAVRHVPVRSAVESVAADLVAAVHPVRQRVQVRLVRERVVEGGVEHARLRDIAEDLAHGFYGLDVGRVVERRQIDHVLDLGEDDGVDADGPAEPLSAVHDAVPDGVDVGQGPDARALGGDEPLADPVDCGAHVLQSAVARLRGHRRRGWR
jgi:hypothetical protein